MFDNDWQAEKSIYRHNRRAIDKSCILIEQDGDDFKVKGFEIAFHKNE